MDIAEIEFKDTTTTTSKDKEITGAMTVEENGNPVYIGYKFRQMRTVKPTNAMSSAWFHYETSPIKIRYIVSYSSWASFWVNMCAIIGGAFAMAGIVERMMRSSLNVARQVKTG
jgi:hypothetical protein